VIDLGSMPLVNNLLIDPHQRCPRWPLKVVFCRSCALAQLTETPPVQTMFDQYVYFSTQSQTMVAHAQRLVERLVKRDQKVLEIASNDGYLLRQAQARGAKVLGVDPARNVAAFANESGVPTRCEYFDSTTARQIEADWGCADVIFALNVLAHVPDPNEVAAGIAILLAEDGIAHIEVPSVVRMIESCAFDTIYHEHHCYFSLSALKSLFNRHGLYIVGVEEMDVHGGSLHVQLARQGDQSKAGLMCEHERRTGVFDGAFYAGFAARVQQLKIDLDRTLDGFDSVAGYGAAAKGVVLLNHFGLDCRRIPWVVDVSPHKQGKFIAGTGQPIVSPRELMRAKPQAALLLAWNIKNEITRANRVYLNQGGRFIVPIPRVAVLNRCSTARAERARTTMKRFATA
jgi:SAM-dependent methyltransferase